MSGIVIDGQRESIERELISAERIQARVRELGVQISVDYAGDDAPLIRCRDPAWGGRFSGRSHPCDRSPDADDRFHRRLQLRREHEIERRRADLQRSQ